MLSFVDNGQQILISLDMKFPIAIGTVNRTAVIDYQNSRKRRIETGKK